MKRVFSLFLTITIMLGIAACSASGAGNTEPEAPINVMRDISTFELVKEMVEPVQEAMITREVEQVKQKNLDKKEEEKKNSGGITLEL